MTRRLVPLLATLALLFTLAAPVSATDTGSITIRKFTIPAGGTNFLFTSGGSLPSIVLDDRQSITVGNLAPGNYGIVETHFTPDFQFEAAHCFTSGPGTSIVSQSGPLIETTLGVGGHIDCTYLSVSPAVAQKIAFWRAIFHNYPWP